MGPVMSDEQDTDHWTGATPPATTGPFFDDWRPRPVDDDPGVCADVPWCGLPAGHGPVVDWRGLDMTHAVTADGVYRIPEDVYHQDPTVVGSLSSSGARRLLPPGCPAKFHDVRVNGEPDRPVWDVGRAAHTKVLGTGAPIQIIPAHLCAKDGAWSTKEAKAAVTAARGAGLTPVKPETAQMIDDMAEALLAHPAARDALTPGDSEVALFWTDPATGVVCRTMLDKLPTTRTPSGRLILADYKTCASAEPAALAKAMHDHGYHQQAEWALTGVEQVGLAEPNEAALLFICQEKTRPYVVTTYYPDSVALFTAADRNRRARELYARCTRAGRWPGYVDEFTGYKEPIIALALPAWAERKELNDAS